MKAALLSFLVLAFFCFAPSQALAGNICNFKKSHIPKALEIKSENFENLSQPLDRIRDWQQAPVIAKPLLEKMLRVSWRAFGYKGKKLRARVRANLKQIKIDSSFRPHLEGLYPGQFAIPEADTPAGLFAFPSHDSYLEWSFYPGWRRDSSRFNPLDNIVAAVGAQVYSGRVFSGKGRIVLPRENDWVCIGKAIKKPFSLSTRPAPGN